MSSDKTKSVCDSNSDDDEQYKESSTKDSIGINSNLSSEAKEDETEGTFWDKHSNAMVGSEGQTSEGKCMEHSTLSSDGLITSTSSIYDSTISGLGDSQI